MSRLVINPNSPQAREIQLKPGMNLLGRGFASDFKIEDASVSGTHCQILINNGIAIIKDLGSTNGTFLNNAAIQEGTLQSGQAIRLGNVSMIFYADDAMVAQVVQAAQAVAALPVARLATSAAHAVSPPVKVALPVKVTPAPTTAPAAPLVAAIAPTEAAHAVSAPVKVALPVKITPTPTTAPAAPLVAAIAPTEAAHAVSAPVKVTLPMKVTPTPTTAPAAPLVAAIAPTEAAPAPAKPVAVVPRLSISSRPAAHTAAPVAAVAALAAPPETEDPSAPMAPPVAGVHTGPRFCKFHPKSYARWLCHKCNRTFCDLCVVSRATAGVTKKTCRSCGVDVMPLQITVERAEQTNFFAALPGALIYPFKGFGSAILIMAGIGFGGVDYISTFLTGPLIWLLQVAAYGFLFLFMQNIIHTTAADEKETLGFPDADGIFGAAFQLAMTILLCFGIPIALLIAKLVEVDVPMSAIVATAVLGCVYFPMAFLAVAMKDTVLAMNPLIVVPAMFKAPFQYFVTTVLLMVVLGSRLLGGMITGFAAASSTTTKDMSVLFLGIGGGILWAFLSIYLMTISMRILGLFYNSNREKLEWF